MFTSKNFTRNFQQLFTDCGNKFKKHLASLAPRPGDGAGVRVRDITCLVAALTMDGIGAIAFGKDLRVWKSVEETGFPNEFSKAFDFLTQYSFIGRMQVSRPSLGNARLVLNDSGCSPSRSIPCGTFPL